MFHLSEYSHWFVESAQVAVFFHLVENSAPIHHRNGKRSRFSWDGSSIETVDANNLKSLIPTGWRQARTTPLAESGVTWTHDLQFIRSYCLDDGTLIFRTPSCYSLVRVETYGHQ